MSSAHSLGTCPSPVITRVPLQLPSLRNLERASSKPGSSSNWNPPNTSPTTTSSNLTQSFLPKNPPRRRSKVVMVGQAGMPPPAAKPSMPGSKFTLEDVQLLIDLKEKRKLTWSQISDFFPGRAETTVRWCYYKRNVRGARCEEIDSNTGQPCLKIFSRPYGLTRHKDTVHHTGKRQIRCDLCVVAIPFSREDTFARHLRKYHPSAE